MTTSVFPSDKTQPFVADNGVTYVYEADRWRVKQYKLDDAALEDYATEAWTEEKIADAMLDGTVDLTNYATIAYSDAEDETLQNQIDELGVTKGKVARYTTDNVSGSPVSRPGQLAFDSSDPASVNLASFGIEDADGVLTKPMANGDIIEFVDAASNKVSRYKILDASGAPTLVQVEYISGNNDFQIGEEEQVYIYPQNASGASKDYVDSQDALHLPLTGGTLSGTVNTKLVKCNRDSGYAFEVKPGDGETISFLHTDGRIVGERVYIKGTNVATHRAFQVMGEKSSGGDPTYDFFYMYTNAPGTPDAINYQGKMDSDFNITNVKYVKDAIDKINAGGVELWGGSNPPPASDRGTLLLTSSNQLYIYTS